MYKLNYFCLNFFILTWHKYAGAQKTDLQVVFLFLYTKFVQYSPNRSAMAVISLFVRR